MRVLKRAIDGTDRPSPCQKLRPQKALTDKSLSRRMTKGSLDTSLVFCPTRRGKTKILQDGCTAFRINTVRICFSQAVLSHMAHRSVSIWTLHGRHFSTISWSTQMKAIGKASH